MGINIPSGTPSAGDTFSWAGFQYVYMTNPDRWVSNGFVGAEDPFADYTLGSFTSTSGLTDRAVSRGTDAFPLRTNFRFSEDGSSGTRQSFGQTGLDLGFTEQTSIFPDEDTQGMWYSNSVAADGTGTIFALIGNTAFDEIRAITSPNNLNLVAALDANDARIDGGTGTSVSTLNQSGRGLDVDPSGFSSTEGGMVMGAGLTNGLTESRTRTGEWSDVVRMVASIAAAGASSEPVSVDILRGNLIATDTFGGNMYEVHWRITRTNLFSELGL